MITKLGKTLRHLRSAFEEVRELLFKNPRLRLDRVRKALEELEAILEQSDLVRELDAAIEESRLERFR